MCNQMVRNAVSYKRITTQMLNLGYFIDNSFMDATLNWVGVASARGELCC